MNFKAFLPFFPTAEIRYSTQLTEEEIVGCLQNVIGPESQFVSIFSSSSKPYSGKINWNKTFELKPTNSTRSLTPIIEGSIDSNENETVVIVTISPDAVQLFLLKFVLFGSVPFMGVQLYLSGEKLDPILFLFLPFFAFGFFFSSISYRSKLRDAMKNLPKLFKAKSEQQIA